MRALLVRLAGAVVLLLVARAAFGFLGILLFVVGGGMVVALTARRFPRRSCLECGGRGRFYSKLLPWYFRLCANCGGNGRVLHRGTPVIGSARAQGEWRDAVAARSGHSRFRERTR
jgi:hypothetical protein